MTLTKRTIAGLFAAVLALFFLTVGPAQAGPAKPSTPAVGAVDDATAPDHAAAAANKTSAAANAALATVQDRIARWVAANGTRYTFGSYVDATSGRMVLETDAPATVISGLLSRTGMSTASTEATSAAVVRRLTTDDSFNRRDDSPPFYGGGGIRDSSSICSSGYAVRASTGVFMVTAGHCFAVGTAVRTESNARAYGTAGNRHLDSITHDKKDLELINGQSYAGRIFTGGITSTTSIPVVSAGGATVGYNNYCHSGRTTGERCGHTANSTTAQVCTSTGCKSPVIAYTGGVVQQGGDSGGTFYAKDSRGAFIRGHVIAGNSTTGYVEPWTVLTATYNVSIVTG